MLAPRGSFSHQVRAGDTLYSTEAVKTNTLWGEASSNPAHRGALKSSSTSLWLRQCHEYNPKPRVGSKKYRTLVQQPSALGLSETLFLIKRRRQTASHLEFCLTRVSLSCTTRLLGSQHQLSQLDQSMRLTIPQPGSAKIHYDVGHVAFSRRSGISVHIPSYSNNYSLQKFSMKQNYKELRKYCGWTCS